MTSFFLPESIKNDLSSLHRMHGVTQDGVDWLRVVTDPFHDVEHQISGYPDGTSDKTYLLRQRVDAVIPSPGAYAWDCQIAMMPEINYATDVRQGLGDYDGFTYDSADASGSLSPIYISRAATAAHMFPNAIYTGQTISDLNRVDTFTNVHHIGGKARLISQAFEVHDTSAEINKQGSVTVYTIPGDYNSLTANVHNDTGPADGTKQTFQSPALPDSIANAVLIPNSRTWEAREGCMCVSTQSNMANPLSHTKMGVRIYGDPPETVDKHVLGTFGTTKNNGAYRPQPWNVTGAFFSGLHQSGTLRISCLRIIEIAPSYDDANVVLATPAAHYDRRALELYAKFSTIMPPGVPVNMNAFGEWYKFVVKAIKGLAPALDMVLPGVGTVVSLGANAIGALPGVFSKKKKSSTTKTNNTMNNNILPPLNNNAQVSTNDNSNVKLNPKQQTVYTKIKKASQPSKKSRSDADLRDFIKKHY